MMVFRQEKIEKITIQWCSNHIHMVQPIGANLGATQIGAYCSTEPGSELLLIIIHSEPAIIIISFKPPF